MRNVRNTGTAKLVPRPLLRAKGLPHKKFADVKIKQRNNQYESRTTLSNNSKGLERCKTYVQMQRILHGYFWRETKWSTFHKRRWRSDKKNSTFLNVSYIAQKTVQQLQKMFFLKNVLQYIILIFYTTESEESIFKVSCMI